VARSWSSTEFGLRVTEVVSSETAAPDVAPAVAPAAEPIAPQA
jgi:hypothetical protein